MAILQLLSVNCSHCKKEACPKKIIFMWNIKMFTRFFYSLFADFNLKKLSKIKIDWRTLIPTGIYLCLVINGNTKKTCEICSKLTIKTPKQRQWRPGISIVDLEQVNAGGECWRLTTIFRSPRQIFTFLRYFYICSNWHHQNNEWNDYMKFALPTKKRRKNYFHLTKDIFTFLRFSPYFKAGFIGSSG